MSASNDGGQTLHTLQHLPVAKIAPSRANPRLVFPQEDLAQLAQSISLKGVLVPVVVAKRKAKNKDYELVDGERRFRCVLELGHATIPAVITDAKDDETTLVDMFNIHMVREPWEDMPTAWALDKLVKARTKRGDTSTDAELEEITGLTSDTIKRLRYAVELPKAWQNYIHSGKIPLNFFWELRVNVIEPLSKWRPTLLAKLGDDKVQAAFVAKRLAGVVTDAVSLRKVRQIISAAGKDAQENQKDESVLDKTIERLVRNKNFTVDEAYEESVELLVELDRLQRKCENMVRAFQRLLERTKDADRKTVKQIGNKLIADLTDVIT